MIKLQAIGHLGKDAEVNNVGGKTVINFSVAHSESYMKDGQKMSKSIWVECAHWTDKTGIVPYLKKGTQVYVEGQPEVKGYVSKSGEPGAKLTLRILSVQLLGGGKSDIQPQQATATTYQQPATQNYGGTGAISSDVLDDTDNSLPF